MIPQPCCQNLEEMSNTGLLYLQKFAGSFARSRELEGCHVTRNQPIVDKVGKGKRVPVGSCVALQSGERILCSVYFHNTDQQTPAKMSEDKPKVSIRFVIWPYFKAFLRANRMRPSSSFILCNLAVIVRLRIYAGERRSARNHCLVFM